MTKKRSKEYDKQYRKTAKYKARRKKYEQSAKRKAYLKKYGQTAKRKAYLKKYGKTAERKAWYKKYNQTVKRKACLKKYDTSTKGKETHRRFAKSAIGRACRSASNAVRTAKRFNTVGKWSGKQFLKLCEKYRNVCLCCRKKRRLTPDHVIPFCKGGTNYLSNIQPLCLSCNTSKRNNTTDYRLSTTQKRPQGVAVQLRKAA